MKIRVEVGDIARCEDEVIVANLFERIRRPGGATGSAFGSSSGFSEIGNRTAEPRSPEQAYALSPFSRRVAVYRDVHILGSEYAAKRERIHARLEDFRRVGSLPDERLFEELCFCILAVQSKAHSADSAVHALAEAGLLWPGRPRQLAAFLRHRTRFHNHKASFIVRARDRFFPEDGPLLSRSLDALPDPTAARVWLVDEIDGLGWKEASHFLRNIGRGDHLAILDRHILRNLIRHGVIHGMPRSLTSKRYLAIESRMKRFADEVKIPMAAIDLLFWSRETGEIFK